MALDLGAGEPAARHRKVTAWARVQTPSGEKVVALVPPVMPLSMAQITASLNQLPSGTSVKGWLEGDAWALKLAFTVTALSGIAKVNLPSFPVSWIAWSLLSSTVRVSSTYPWSGFAVRVMVVSLDALVWLSR